MIPFIYRDLEPILQQLPDPLELTRLLGALGIFMILIDKQKVVMFLGKKIDLFVALEIVFERGVYLKHSFVLEGSCLL